MAKVFISKINGEELEHSLQWLGFSEIIDVSKPVFIKPNLTFTIHKPGVTVRPEFILSIIKILTEMGVQQIEVCESDGGYGSFSANEAFIGHDLVGMAKDYGFKLRNLTDSNWGYLKVGKINLPFPEIFLGDEVQLISIAVPKVHPMTGISLCIKNLWGLIPDPMRLKYHYKFNSVIMAINRRVKPILSLIDGKYGLTCNGPMDGESITLDTILASDDSFAIDNTMRKLMGWENLSVPHLDYARKLGLYPTKTEFNVESVEDFSTEFFLKRSIWNYGALAAFNSRALTNLFYDSHLSNLFHSIMYSFRSKLHIPRF